MAVSNIKDVMLRFSECHNRPPPPTPALPPPDALAPVAAALVLPGGWQIEGHVPATIRRAGPQAAERTVEFFTAQIRNPHTRAAPVRHGRDAVLYLVRRTRARA